MKLNEIISYTISFVDYDLAVIVAFMYIIMKLTIKHIIRNLVEKENDVWDTLSWFSVDIIFITFAACIIARLDPILNNNVNKGFNIQVLWISILAFLTIILILLYGAFIKRMGKINKSPFSDFWLFFYITSSYFLSFGGFLLSYRNFNI